MNFFSLVSVLISLAAVASYVDYRYIKLPTTLVSQIAFNQIVVHGMLVFLLFAGSIQESLEACP